MNIEIIKVSEIDDSSYEIDYELPIYITNAKFDTNDNSEYYAMETINIIVKKNPINNNNVYITPKNSLNKIKNELSKKYSVDINRIVFNSPVLVDDFFTDKGNFNFFLYTHIEFQGEHMTHHMRRNKIKNILNRI